MMKKYILLMLGAMLALTSCHEKVKKEDPIDITGQWELSAIATKASIGGTSVSVYLSFETDGTFDIFQKLGEGRYYHYHGTYTLTDKSLEGTYSGGSTWGPYVVTADTGSMTLSREDGVETDTYKKVSTIPESVTSGALEY